MYMRFRLRKLSYEWATPLAVPRSACRIANGEGTTGGKRKRERVSC